MAHPINMPQVGQDIETAVITEWKVKVGDRVEKGDVVALVESDKAVFEVESFESGTVLKILFDEDEEACVLEPIAVVGEKGEDPESSSASLETGTPGKAEEDIPDENKHESDDGSTVEVIRISASPSARRLAGEMGLDLDQVKGSGPQGRIVKEDVLNAAQAGSSGKASESSGTGEMPALNSLDSRGDRVIPFSRMRQTIADRLTRSYQTIPHFYLTIKADVSEFMAWREQFLDRSGRRISVNALAVKAAAAALQRFPKMNSHVSPDSLTLCRNVNIGIAVSLEEGLIVPVIHEAPDLELDEIAARIREISESARGAVLTAGPPATFTVSNLGMLGVSGFMPIINPPEAGILGIGAVEKRLVLMPDGDATNRDILPLTLGCDHRAVDGYYAGQFLQNLREEIEKIELWQNL